MRNVANNIFFKSYIILYIHKNLRNKIFMLFLFSSFFFLHQYSTGYAMQTEGEELVEQQNVRRPLIRGEDLNITSYVEEKNQNAMQTKREELVEQQNVERAIVQGRREDLNLISHEEEREQSCKNSWFVKNVIAEFPIIGAFFHADLSDLDALKKAGHSTFMLLGGSFGMMLDVVPKSEYDGMTSSMAKSTINMAIGMWAGAAIYNTMLSLGHIGYNCVKPCFGRNLQTSTADQT